MHPLSHYFTTGVLDVLAMQNDSPDTTVPGLPATVQLAPTVSKDDRRSIYSQLNASLPWIKATPHSTAEGYTLTLARTLITDPLRLHLSTEERTSLLRLINARGGPDITVGRTVVGSDRFRIALRALILCFATGWLATSTAPLEPSFTARSPR